MARPSFDGREGGEDQDDEVAPGTRHATRTGGFGASPHNADATLKPANP